MRQRLARVPLIVAAIVAAFVQGCSVNVSVRELTAVAKPGDALQQFNGIYQVSSGEISDLFWGLPYEAKTLRVSGVSATQMTLAAIKEDGTAESVTVHVRADHGYLFLSKDRTAYSHAMDAFHIRSATGVGLDANGNLVWHSDVRELVRMVLIIPILWFHQHKDGNARRISDAADPG